MEELECPYCGVYNRVPDESYEEDYPYECECDCGKTFGFTVDYIRYYTEYKLPCANDGNHKWEQMHGAPEWVFTNRRMCKYCGEEKELTWDDEGYIEVISEGF